MFYDNFVRCCNSVNKSPSAVAADIGLSRASVNGWKNGKNPTDANLAKIADYFGVSVDYLLGKTEQKEKAPAETEASDPLSQVSFALFGKHEELDDEILGELREYARFKLEQKKHKEKK